MSAKTLCPNKTTFRVSEGLGCRHIFGGPLFTTVVLDVIPFPPMPMPGQKKKKRSGRAGESCLFELRFQIKSNSWI